ncbi:MAG: selenide, water dikinase SelD, partial [Planctomycetales bacterium]|nr:selenide, water dikinase SelD [Planctomycetales bacterium]
MERRLAQHEAVLLGVGHTNAHVLRMWRMHPWPDCQLTCISNFPVATYAGMMPGVLAQQYPPAQMQIDLVRLCASANARLILDRVIGLDRDRQAFLFANRPPLTFDVAAIGIGSVPAVDGIDVTAKSLLTIKPMQVFLPELKHRIDTVIAGKPRRELQIVVVGGGVGGVEIAFCLAARLRHELPQRRCTLTIVHGGDAIPQGVAAGTARRVQRELQRAGIVVRLRSRVTQVADDHVVMAAGESLPADIVIWAASARGPSLLSQLGLATDERGFLLTRSTLQTVDVPDLFAVGDTGTIQEYLTDPTPKAGVYAVRQGPVLWENMRRRLEKRPLTHYRPQHDFLKLINLGERRAIAEYRGMSASGTWAWRLKDRIDTQFMAKYQDYAMPRMQGNLATSAGLPDERTRCAGCGGKIGGGVLRDVLDELEAPQNEHVVVGLKQPDDAAVLRLLDSCEMTVSTDFFAAPLNDPYLVGRLAALNSLSDLHAMNTQPMAALAMITLPVGPALAQRRMLRELLAGSLHELRQHDVALVGGHTIEGPQLTAGFTVLGENGERPLKPKSGLRVGDVLVLTKPLGTGVLLAAHMGAACRAEWYEPLLESMLYSNHVAIRAATDATAVTDVTGFGLAWHLLEMLRASSVSARVRLESLPLLPGAFELAQQGWESTLAPANRECTGEIRVDARLAGEPRFSLLFDPQTCGGLLIGMAAESVPQFIADAQTRGEHACCVIGE